MSDLQETSQHELLDSLLGDFLDESDQLLTQLNERLLQLDAWVRALGDDHHEQCDPSLLNEMFRAAHSLKGLSAMLGLADINNLTHKIENVFDAARKNELAVNGDVTELVFMGLDQLTALIDRLKQPGGEPVDCSAVVDAIRRLLQTAGVEKKQSSQAEADRVWSREQGAGSGEQNNQPSPPTPLPEGEGSTMPTRRPGCSPLPAPGSPLPAPRPAANPFDDIQDESEIPQKYLSIFICESEEALDALTGTLLAMEGGGDADALKSLMGTAHKIKGSAASIGLNRIAKLAHMIEDVLQELAQTHGSLSSGVADVLLKCTDALQRHVAELKHGTASSDHFGQLACDLLAARSGDSAAEPPSHITYVGEVKFQPSLAAAGLKASLICEKLAKLGQLSDCDPKQENLDEIDKLDCFRFHLATDQPLEAVEDRLRIAGVVEARVERLPSPAGRGAGGEG